MDTVKADEPALLIEDAVLAVLMDDPWPAGLRLVDGEAAELAALPELPAAVLRPVGGAAPVAAAVPVAGPAAVAEGGELAVHQAPPAAAPDVAPEREPVAARVAEWAGMGLRLAGIGPDAAPASPAPAPVAASAGVPEPQDWPLLSVLPAPGGAAAPAVAGEAAPLGMAPGVVEAGAAPVARDAVRWNDDADPGFAPVAAPASAWPGFPPAARAEAAVQPERDGQAPGGEEAAAPETAMQGVIEVDGAALGRFVAEHLAREAGRPPSGMTGFDPRLTPGWGGAIQG